MRKHAVLVHINAIVRITPLVGGYLKAFAYADPELRRAWDIELYSTYVRTPASTVIRDLVTRRPDVIGFSVYTWNVRLVMRLLRALRGLLPATTQFLLGGVEVMHCAPRYLDRTWENVTVCNGEGEQSFVDFLVSVQAGGGTPDAVRGTSFARDGQWHTTAELPRIRDLSTIPSPWLAGVFTPQDLEEVAIFETNRGCPFACEFCYWGGAIGERVNKLEFERLEEEISYIAGHRSKTLALCDANFGMLPRDVDLAEHIAAMNRRHRAPSRVLYNSAKNNPDRVEQVARIFFDAGMLSNQAISLQTLNDRALALAKRGNIKQETYLRLQRRLNEWGVPSHIELIWPLPGETLQSFKDGVNTLASMGAQCFTIYPLLWLNNIGYAGRTEEYGVATLQEEDAVSGGEVVIQTNEAPFADYLEGLRYAMSVYLLHNCRGLYTTMAVLNALGIASFSQCFDRFAEMMDRTAGDDGVSRLWHEGRTHFENLIEYIWQGSVAYTALHGDRKALDGHLESFLGEQAQWMAGEHGRLLRSAFEFDLLSRPFPFLQTPLELGVELRELSIRERRRGMWQVESMFDFPRIVRALRTTGAIAPEDLAEAPVRIRINHRHRQVFRLPAKRDEEHYWHTHQVVREINNHEPAYEVEAAELA